MSNDATIDRPEGFKRVSAKRWPRWATRMRRCSWR